MARVPVVPILGASAGPHLVNRSVGSFGGVLVMTCSQDIYEPIVRGACHLLAHNPHVESIQIVVGTRPTYDQLMRYSRIAAERQLAMILVGMDGVAIQFFRHRSQRRVVAGRDLFRVCLAAGAES